MTLQSMRIVCVHIDSMVSFSTPSTTAAQLEQLNYYSIESNEVIRYCSATHSSSTANPASRYKFSQPNSAGPLVCWLYQIR